jgi:hypothetical protein
MTRRSRTSFFLWAESQRDESTLGFTRKAQFAKRTCHLPMAPCWAQSEVEEAPTASVALPMRCTHVMFSALSIHCGDMKCSLLRCAPRSMPTRDQGIGVDRSNESKTKQVEPSPMVTEEASP